MKLMNFPSRVTAVIPLPEECAAVYSPGLGLHVSGSGPTHPDARQALVANLCNLAEQLRGYAEEIRMGEE